MYPKNKEEMKVGGRHGWSGMDLAREMDKIVKFEYNQNCTLV